MKKIVAVAAAALAVSCLAPRPLQAAEGAASRPNLLCALTMIISCDTLGDCERVTADDVYLADFLRVDFKEMKIKNRKPGDERATVISSMSVAEGNTILTGGENGRGWTAVISADGDKMNASVVDDVGAFLLFANCLPE